MAFHRFQQLPFELRQQIWEFALDHALSIDDFTDEHKRVCRMVRCQASPEFSVLPTELLTLEHYSLAHVCRESRQVLRRCRGRLYNARHYIPLTDVLYLENFDSFFMMSWSLLSKLRHIALPADICYKMLTEDGISLNALGKFGWSGRKLLDILRDLDSGFVGLPELESMTIVLPPLQKSMPYYAYPFTTSLPQDRSLLGDTED